MTTVYKLTDHHSRTYKSTIWGAGITHSADLSAPAELCSRGVIHGYRSPLLAVLLNPIHADFNTPRLWLAKGEIAADDGLKVGCRTLTTVKKISLPKVTPAQRVVFGILCAMEVYRETDFVLWANRWLSGEDRSVEPTWVWMGKAVELTWALDKTVARPARAAAMVIDAPAKAVEAAARVKGQKINFVQLAEDTCARY